MRSRVGAFLFFVFLFPLLSSAQTTSSLEGTVVDPEGKAVTNAAVILRNEATNTTQALTTDESGHFAATNLQPGLYAVEVSAGGFATVRRSGIRIARGETQNLPIRLALAGVNEQVTVSAALPAAAKSAPSQGSLTSRSAQSIINDSFIRNDTSPVADYTQITQMAPGTFSFSPNGVGLGDSKTFFRGFSDSQYNLTFDGIPLNDTNDSSHHSWAFFPVQFVGGTVFDRSPGSATTIGASTYGGSVNLLSRELRNEQSINATVSKGSFNTRLYDVEYDSGNLGASRLMFDAHEMTSDGYQTFNHQKRDAGMVKYQYAASEKTQITLFGSYLLLHANTPNFKGPTRAQVDKFGKNYLLSGNPNDPNYFGYNFYRVPTDFDYAGFRSDLGHGWSIDDKLYTFSYYNKQNFNSTSAISATSATDKLNSYRKYGNLLPLTHDGVHGIFRAGLWTEYAKTNRFQTPSDPRTWVDAALPNFHERFNTTTLQPYVEYEWKLTPELHITPGLKYAQYTQDFTQYADNGKVVGNLGGKPFVTHSATYHAWLPSFDAHYTIKSNWSAYVQYGKGQDVPPTNVFDVKNAAVAVLPKPVLTSTYQIGSVWKSDRFTFDVDAFHIHFQNDYSSSPDAVTGEPVYYLTGTSTTKGIEAESNVLLGYGLSAYVNATAGSAKYDASGLWVQNAPRDTETLGLHWQSASWDLGLFNKRIGRLYNDNGSTHQAVTIDPFHITNLFVNYTFNGSSAFAHSKLKLSVNNLFNDHKILGVNPASSKTSVPAPGDVLNLEASRSVALTFTVGFAPNAAPIVH